METFGAAVVTTTSGRGALAEDHPNVVRFDRRSTGSLERAGGRRRSVLALGCKFSHKQGPRLPAAPVGRSPHPRGRVPGGPGANYDASLTLASGRSLRSRALSAGADGSDREGARGLVAQELDVWRTRAEGPAAARPSRGSRRPPGGHGRLRLPALRRALPPQSCLVLDSGLHQMMARATSVLCPRGLILPTDLQSMATRFRRRSAQSSPGPTAPSSPCSATGASR